MLNIGGIKINKKMLELLKQLENELNKEIKSQINQMFPTIEATIAIEHINIHKCDNNCISLEINCETLPKNSEIAVWTSAYGISEEEQFDSKKELPCNKDTCTNSERKEK